MGGLVDIHSHLIPGIDDGPPDLEGSLEMARAAVHGGIATIAATPHLRGDFPGVVIDELAERCGELQSVLDDRDIPLRVVSGAEASLIWALDATDEQLKLASYGQRGTDLLIETPNDVSMIGNLLSTISSRGYRVTLAHPERSPEFWRRPERLERLAEQGVLLQVNAAALIRRRSQPGRFAERLVRAGTVHVIGSDAHRASDWRPISELPEAMERVSEMVGPELAGWLCAQAPAAVLDGVALPTRPAAVTSPRRRSWLPGISLGR